MRKLEFANIDQHTIAAGDHRTVEGGIACMRQLCPSLTVEEAQRAVLTARDRHILFTIPATKALLREMFEH